MKKKINVSFDIIVSMFLVYVSVKGIDLLPYVSLFCCFMSGLTVMKAFYQATE